MRNALLRLVYAFLPEAHIFYYSCPLILNMLRKFLLQEPSLVLIFLFLSLNVFGQELDGQFLKGRGEIPSDFLESWSTKFQRSIDNSLSTGEDEDDLEDFWLEHHHGIDELLQSGRYSFGDPLTVYLNEIADHLLRNDPELRGKIRIYTFRSPSVNAFTVADGIIAMHTGLFAHVKSEAELAFVISHEIAHYTQNHFYQKFKDFRDETENSWSNPSLSPLALAESRIDRSKEHEIEADQFGLELYLQSDYALEAVDSLLTTLHRSYIPYGRSEVNSNPFCLVEDCFELPEFYYRDEISPISLPEDYADAALTHPNIGSRRTAIQSALVQREIKPGKYFVISESRFKKLREIARFEVVREHLITGGFAKALYDIYVLQKEHPNNKFLNIAQVKALYGLASFKAVDELNLVIPSSTNIEGPSQQMMHLIKQMNRSQLVTIALQASLKAEELYPEEKFLKRYSSELAKYLLVYCDEEAADFKADAKAIPAFDNQESDFRSPRAYYRAQQKHYHDFHRYLINDPVDQEWLAQEMEKHYAYRDSIEEDRLLTVEEREERYEDYWEEIEEKGSGLNIREVVVLDPIIRVINIGDDLEERLDGLEQEREFKQNLPQWIKAQGIQAELLYSESMTESDVDRYNRFCQLEEWFDEARAFNSFDLMPVSIDVREKLPEGTRYVCRIIGVVNKDGWDSYYFGLFDLKQGEVIYFRNASVGLKLSMSDLEEETKKDLKNIFN